MRSVDPAYLRKQFLFRANDRDIKLYRSRNTRNKLFDVARPFLYSRRRFSQTLRGHLASRYYRSIYRSIYRLLLLRSGRHLCDVISMIHRRHEAPPRRTKGTYGEAENEKKRKTQGGKRARSTRKCARHHVGRGNYVFRESTELHWRGVMDRRIAEIQVRRERKRERARIESHFELSLLPFFRSRLHFPSARPIEEAARVRGKKRERGERRGRKGRRREASATQRRRNKRRYVNEIK